MSDDDFEGGEPPEEDLPPTGPHHVLPGDEGEEGGGIPSFEEYRRAREERGRGAWSPFGAGAQSGAGGETGEEPERSGEVEDTLPVRSRPEAAGDGEEEDSGDTLDGGQSLADLGLGDELEDLEPRRFDENGDPITFEEQLAEAAGDVLPSGFEHSEEEIRARRMAAHRRHRRNGRIRLLILLAVIALIVLIVVDVVGGGGKKKTHTPPAKHAPSLPTSAGHGTGQLLKGSDPSVLPGNVLIADWGGRRLLAVSPTGQIVWTYHVNGFQSRFNPDYAFFNAAGNTIAISQESHSQIGLFDVAKRQFTYHYGHYDHPGSAIDYLHDPETAIELADGKVLAADIRNCRIVVVEPPQHFKDVHDYGHVGHCTHAPPRRLDNPVSAFPLHGGGIVITELGGYVDLLSAAGKLTASVPVPGFTRPVAANQAKDGNLVAVDHTHPGAVEIFTTAGKRVWSYKVRRGAGELFDPSMAILLPGGHDVLVSDDYNARVVVIDIATHKIVWQYGHLHHRSSANGYLYLPVGVDLVHPYSLLDGFPTATAPR